MKNLKLILTALLSIVLLASCKKYLEVTPKTQMPQDLLFSTEGGFKDALTGAYIQMNHKDAYGAALTQTTIEAITSSWDVTANTSAQRMGLFTYTDQGVQDSLASIFAQQYKIISSVNAILGQIDTKKNVFATPGLYELIKGEALAIRAYCHLDILRLFGPIPTAPTVGNNLAYVTTLSKNINNRVAFTAFQTALLKDLADAEALLKDTDPITKYSIVQLKAPSSSLALPDTYFGYRDIRMNYYAVKALQARAQLWFNNPQQAYLCAKEIIDAKNTDGTNKFNLGGSADFAAGDFVLTKEHIFGLYDFNMFNKYTQRYANGTFRKGTTATTITNQLYGNTGTDIRESSLWELITLPNTSKAYIIKKYRTSDLQPTDNTKDYKQIPMLRLSEMYLIAAETASYAEGVEYLRQFRVARNVGQSSQPANTAALQIEVLKEYRKEFYAEGQGFFAYKRVNAPKASFLFVPSAATLNYLLPLPYMESI